MGLSWEGCLTSELIGPSGQLLGRGCPPCPETHSSCFPAQALPLQSLQQAGQEQTVLTHGKGYLLIWLYKLAQPGVRQEAMPGREWEDTGLMPSSNQVYPTAKLHIEADSKLELDMYKSLAAFTEEDKSIQLPESCVQLFNKKMAKSLNWHRYVIPSFAFPNFYSRKYVTQIQTHNRLCISYTDSI